MSVNPKKRLLKFVQTVIMFIIFIGLLIPVSSADPVPVTQYSNASILLKGNFAKVSQIKNPEQKQETTYLLLGQNDISITPEIITAGDQIIITINAGTAGVNQFIDIYNNRNKLQKEFIKLTDCVDNTCTNLQKASFNVPEDWSGDYYISVFDKATEDYSSFDFYVKPFEKPTEDIPVKEENTSSIGPARTPLGAYVPGEIIVKFREDPETQENTGFFGLIETAILQDPKIETKFSSVNEKNKVFRVKSFKSASPKKGSSLDQKFPHLKQIQKFTLEDDSQLESALDSYNQDPNVEYASPNYIYSTTLEPNDPLYTNNPLDLANQWFLPSINANDAWNTTTGDSSIVIAVIDTGIDMDHPDLAANLWNNIDEDCDDTTDLDGNTYFGDCRGYDFVDRPPGDPDCDGHDSDCYDIDNVPEDGQGHGTHVSGIAASVTNNNNGTAGVCWNCKIMPLRAGFNNSNGLGSIDIWGAGLAIYYAIDNGADIISMSFGGNTSVPLIETALNEADSVGLVLIASAGNTYDDTVIYPAAQDNVLAIAALDENNTKSVFSTYGTWVNLSAPGSQILSTHLDAWYYYMWGTSQVTPIVAGIAGLILSENPSLTNTEVYSILKSTATNIDADNPTYIGKLGAGKVDAEQAVLAAQAPSLSQTASLYSMAEFNLTTTNTYTNPFNQVNLSAVFTSPTGTNVLVKGFYDGSDTWRIRFNPNETGLWSFTTSSTDNFLDGKTGTLDVLPSSNKGFLKVDPSYPHYFSYGNGEYPLLLGTTGFRCLDMNNDVTSIINDMKNKKIEKVIIQVALNEIGGDCSINSCPWPGPANNPDFAQFNLNYWDHVDDVMDELNQNNITVALSLLWQVDYGSAQMSVADVKYLTDYTIARLSSYPNFGYWYTINEYNLLGWADKVGNAREVATYIQSNDPYIHPVSIHDGHGGFPFSGEAWPDMEIFFNKDFTAPIIAQDYQYNKPLINEEPANDNNGPGGSYFNPGLTTLLTNMSLNNGYYYRAFFWNTLLRGGYPTYLGQDHWQFCQNTSSNGPSDIIHVSNFFNGKEFWKMIPDDNLIQNIADGHCANINDNEIICYLQKDTSFNLNLTSLSGSFNASWYNPRTGVFNSSQILEAGSVHALTTYPPGSGPNSDTVLYLNTIPTPLPDLVAHWKLDEGSNPTVIVDETGNNNGTCTNCPINTSGMIGGAYYFDGSNDYITFSDSPSLDSPSTTNEITISAWIKPSNLTFTDRVVSKFHTSSGQSFNLVTRSLNPTTGRLGAYLYCSSTPYFTAFDDLTFNIGEWSHIAFTYNGTSVKGYIDGVESSDIGTSPGCIDNSAASLTIGTDADYNYDFNGSVDDVRIYNRALNDSEIYDLFNISQPILENCSDNIQNQDETGVDCGGSCPDPCLVKELKSSYNIPVLVINYMPVGFTTDNITIVFNGTTYLGDAIIDFEETGINSNVSAYMPRLANGAQEFADYLTNASRYHGYKNSSAEPALNYSIVETINILQAKEDSSDPIWSPQIGYPRGRDMGNLQFRHPYNYILTQSDICNYVGNFDVKVVFLSSYHYNFIGPNTGSAVPAESMSAGPYGNIGNSEASLANYLVYCNGSTPISTPLESDRTYHIIAYHESPHTYPSGGSVEDMTHHIEELFRFVDIDLWNRDFVGLDGYKDWQRTDGGLLAGESFDFNDYGLRITVNNIIEPTSSITISDIGAGMPNRDWPSDYIDDTRTVNIDESFIISAGEHVDVAGKDIKIRHWTNNGLAYFLAYIPSKDFGVVKDCGWTHYPPNGAGDYDWTNNLSARSHCEEWSPDESKAISSVNCHQWFGDYQDTCVNDPGPWGLGSDLGFKLWWMQNIPGKNNDIRWNKDNQTRHARNFWAFIYDFDGSIAKSQSLSFNITNITVEPPTNLIITNETGYNLLNWTNSTAPGVIGYNIFRSRDPAEEFHRVNNDLVANNFYNDSYLIEDDQIYFYQVKAVAEVQSEFGAGGATQQIICTDNDSDGFNQSLMTCGIGDCNDSNPNVFPGQIELCNWIDDDCDGRVDEGLNIDADFDGYNSLDSCYSNFDCNDSDASINPDAIEVCDEIDNNCDSRVDETCGPTIAINPTEFVFSLESNQSHNQTFNILNDGEEGDLIFNSYITNPRVDGNFREITVDNNSEDWRGVEPFLTKNGYYNISIANDLDNLYFLVDGNLGSEMHFIEVDQNTSTGCFMAGLNLDFDFALDYRLMNGDVTFKRYDTCDSKEELYISYNITYGERAEVGVLLSNITSVFPDVSSINFRTLQIQPKEYALQQYSWLNLSTFSGTISELNNTSNTIYVNTSSMPQGSYEAIIKIKSNDPNNPEITLPVALNVTNPPVVTLHAPPNGTISSTGNITFNCSATDDQQVDNITLFVGTPGLGLAPFYTESDSDIFLEVSGIAPDDYIWNCRATDNESQEAFAPQNYSFSIIVANCSDNIQNQDETGTDCGGSCPPCPTDNFTIDSPIHLYPYDSNFVQLNITSLDPSLINWRYSWQGSDKPIVYAIGDSITQGKGSQFSSQLNNLTNLNITNVGIGSEECSYMIDRFDDDVPDNVDIVILQCGVNDLWMGETPEQIITYLDRLYELTMQKGADLIIWTLLPHNYTTWSNNRPGGQLTCENKFIVNNHIKGVMSTYPNVTVVDLYDEFTNGTDCIVNDSLTTDGTHPNAEGNMIIGRKIWQDGLKYKVYSDNQNVSFTPNTVLTMPVNSTTILHVYGVRADGSSEHAQVDVNINALSEPCDVLSDCPTESCKNAVSCADNKCVYANMADDTSCDDGSYCNGVDTCQSGLCVSSGSPCSDDGYVCTLDCDETNDNCNVIQREYICNDDNDCTDDTCTGTGCQNIANDANTCTLFGSCSLNHRCESGSCVADSNPNLCTDYFDCQSTSCDSSYLCDYASCSPVPSDLVLYLPLDGDFNDLSDYDNDGKCILRHCPITQANGKIDRAIEFDGEFEYVKVLDSDELDDTSELTLSAWIYPRYIDESEESERGIISKRILFNYDLSYFFGIHGNNLRASVDEWTGFPVVSTTAIQPNQWYHVAMVYNGNLDPSERIKIYVNGSLDATGSEASSSIPNYRSHLWVGTANADSWQGFNGSIDEVRVYRRALSDSEIYDLYNITAPTPGDCSNGIQDGSETGIDCGGSCPIPCNDLGDIYFVDPVNGNDATGQKNNITKPFQHLNSIQGSISAGDIIYLRSGNYVNDWFWPSNSGNETHPITIKSYPGEQAVISGRGHPDWSGIINLGWISSTSLDYFIIEDIDFINATTIDIYVSQGGHHNIIRNNRFENSNTAMIFLDDQAHHNTIEDNIFVNASIPGWTNDEYNESLDYGSPPHINVRESNYNLIQNNYFSKAGLAAVVITGTNNNPPIPSDHNIIRNNAIEQHYGTGISILLGSSNNIVENNEIYYAGAIMANYPKAGIQVTSPNNIIRNNRVGFTGGDSPTDTYQKSKRGILVASYYFSNCACTQHAFGNRVYNNVFYKSGGNGIFLYQRHSGNTSDNLFVNNILFNDRMAGPGAYSKGELFIESYNAYTQWTEYANGNQWINNIILYANSTGDYPDIGYLIKSSSLISSQAFEKNLSDAQQQFPNVFIDNIEENPQFVNADGKDFNLQPSSPAIDSGATLSYIAETDNDKYIPLMDGRYFSDGYGIVLGDQIKIGDSTHQLSFKNFITIESSTSYSSGTDVIMPPGNLLTNVSETGAGTIIKVDGLITIKGHGVIVGDRVDINGENITITYINTTTKEIWADRPISFNQGDPVKNADDIVLTQITDTNTNIYIPIAEIPNYQYRIGIVPGKEVKIDGNLYNITKLNDPDILTVDSPISFAQGQPVNLLYQGNAPDIGAIESIYSAGVPPTLLGIECSDGAIWKPCSDFIYGEPISQVHATCTDSDGDVESVSFVLNNVPDGLKFDITKSSGVGGVYTADSSYTITDSGDFTLTVTCTDNDSKQTSQQTTWNIPWGTLTATQLNPSTDANVTMNEFFLYRTSINCTGGECGDVTAAADPTQTFSITTGIEDTYIDGNARTTNYGPNKSLFVRQGETLESYQTVRPLIRFNNLVGGAPEDIIKPGSTINEATLHLYQGHGHTRSTDINVYVHALFKNWTETGATFETYDGINGWELNGTGGDSDKDPVPDDQVTISQTAIPQWYTFNVTRSLQMMTDLEINNNRWVLTGDTAVWPITYFYSKEMGSNNSYLVVDYTPTGMKGIIPEGSGTPFYTNGTNPLTITNLKAGDSSIQEWWVNATAESGTYEFYVIYDAVQNGVSDIESEHVNITVTTLPSPCTDNDGDGFNQSAAGCGVADCNDSNQDVFPGQTELCNGIDDDCDTSIDEEYSDKGGSCTVGIGECENSGIMVCNVFENATVCNAIAGNPSDEVCDGLDNDCNGIIDNGNNTLCDDGLYCNGLETCNGALGCLAGTPINCSSNNLAKIATCTNNPDNNSLTWDYFTGFTSVCNETNDSCTVEAINITHICNTSQCGAECDQENPCADTDCNGNNGCYQAGLQANLTDCFSNNTCEERVYNSVTSFCDLLGTCGCTAGTCDVYGIIEVDNDSDTFDRNCDQDCNDNNPYIFPANSNTFCDCDPTNDSITQGAVEICDSIDNDCDGFVDEDDVCVSPLICNFTNAYWLPNLSSNNKIVKLIVEGENCQNKEVRFDVWESAEALEIDGDDDVLEDPHNTIFVGVSASANWTALYDGYEVHLLLGNPEYYFIAYLVENESINITSNLLEVLETCPDNDTDGYEDSACGGTDCDDTNPKINPGADDPCGDAIDQNCDGADPSCPAQGPSEGSSRSSERRTPPQTGEQALACSWTCSEWGECIDGIKTRTCTMEGNCYEADLEEKPDNTRSCKVQDKVSVDIGKIDSKILTKDDYELTIKNTGQEDLVNVEIEIDAPPGWEVEDKTSVTKIAKGQSVDVRFRMLIPFTNKEQEEIKVIVKSDGRRIATKNVQVGLDIPSFLVAAEPSLNDYKGAETIKIYYVIDNRGKSAKQDVSIEFNLNLGHTTKVLDLVEDLNIDEDDVYSKTKIYDINDLPRGEYEISARLYEKGFMSTVSKDSLDLTNK